MIERVLRGIAGTMILVSLALGVYIHQGWLWVTGFIGLNLLQSAFTNWCLMMTILRRLGMK